jgi:hypothetical protein
MAAADGRVTVNAADGLQKMTLGVVEAIVVAAATVVNDSTACESACSIRFEKTQNNNKMTLGNIISRFSF